MSVEFTCDMCHGVFEKCRPEGEAEAECIEIFGSMPTGDNLATVCDDCWRKIDPRQFEVA